jgi:hypothetical protein
MAIIESVGSPLNKNLIDYVELKRNPVSQLHPGTPPFRHRHCSVENLKPVRLHLVSLPGNINPIGEYVGHDVRDVVSSL